MATYYPDNDHNLDPACGEDHEVGSRPNHCFACLSEQRDELLAALKACRDDLVEAVSNLDCFISRAESE